MYIHMHTHIANVCVFIIHYSCLVYCVLMLTNLTTVY